MPHDFALLFIVPVMLGCIVAITALLVAAVISVVVRFFASNQHMTLLRWVYTNTLDFFKKLESSLWAAAQWVSLHNHQGTLNRVLLEAESARTKAVFIVHSHGGMVIQQMLDSFPQQQRHLLSKLVIIGIGNPNCIVAPEGSQCEIYQY